MKNVFKKMFSLLLVGVVAVSMFGFIKLNCVEAAEAHGEDNKGLIVVNNSSEWAKYWKRADFSPLTITIKYEGKVPSVTSYKKLNRKVVSYLFQIEPAMTVKIHASVQDPNYSHCNSNHYICIDYTFYNTGYINDKPTDSKYEAIVVNIGDDVSTNAEYNNGFVFQSCHFRRVNL